MLQALLAAVILGAGTVATPIWPRSPLSSGAYAPLTGAGCGAPLELIVEVVVVEAVAELSAEMAVDVVLPALLPPRSRSTAVFMAASIASPCEHTSHTFFLVRLDGQRMSQRCVLCSAAAIASCLRRNFQPRRARHPEGACMTLTLPLYALLKQFA